MHTFQIHLASTSPRRRALLDQLGIRYCVQPVEVDETLRLHETSEQYVLRLALAKARAGWQACSASAQSLSSITVPDSQISATSGSAPRCPVLGADTSVVIAGEVLGKPRDREDGLEMLERLSGCSHQVMTAIALVEGAREATRLSVSTVVFCTTTLAERAAYWETGEPLGKAGGYAIQGRAAAFITRLEGSFSGVMGLPLYETADILNEFGIAVLR